ncbi:OmpA family protein [Spirosoma fluviale]|uniref:Outer membrane protein OmpA n=1 Tax=Spirosoma fluviale TaxID=1597977 RepID=A0A286G0W6_9BACT|nr:PA14 domain-containing protein [Spirosoma fluviale]SOD89092.1 Outer membrane protein OmpA [Spirosoma fluviale]
MKAIGLLNGIISWLVASQALAQQGLKGDYYEGTNFERKVFTRIDPQLNFNWRGRSPGPGMPESYYSIRWTGKLLAPASGEYRFYAKVDDGIRVWVGNKKVMDSWQLNDSESFGGRVILEAGKYYDLRVDFFNDMLEGEIQLFWQRPDAQHTLNPFSESGTLITGQHFFQKAVPNRVTLAKTPEKPAPTPPVIASTAPKTIPPKEAKVVVRKPVIKPPAPQKAVVLPTIALDTPQVAATSPPVNKPDFNAGTTFTLHHVQFEQSSYILVPESSAELDKLVRAMKENPARAIEVSGHTDNVGDPRLNLALSENRAKVVASYLKRRGIAEDRITTTGYGGTRPIGDNTTEGERAKNRRVEITIR